MAILYILIGILGCSMVLISAYSDYKLKQEIHEKHRQSDIRIIEKKLIRERKLFRI